MAKPTFPSSSARTNVLSLKVTLRGVRPPIWRRLLISGTKVGDEFNPDAFAIKITNAMLAARFKRT